MNIFPEVRPERLLRHVHEVAAQALREDLGNGDLTTNLLPEDKWSQARLLSREAAVLCGSPWFNSVFKQLDERVRISWQVKEGATIARDQVLCTLAGSSRALLTGERTAINFIQTLSGTATVTRAYLRQLENTSTKLLDTRKTIPGLREAQKYAVHIGGGHNHRLGLFDGILIKENHITAIGSITKAIQKAKECYPKLPIEVEIESLAQLEEAIYARADLIMLDNFPMEQLREAVAITAGRCQLEASGDCSLSKLAEIAAIGVNYISVGALTKHIRALDLSMQLT